MAFNCCLNAVQSLLALYQNHIETLLDPYVCLLLFE